MGRRREGVFFTSSMPDKCLFRATGCRKESSARAAAFGFQNNPPPVSNRKHTRDAAGIRYVEEEEREVSLSRHSLSLSLLIHSSGVHFIVAHMCGACFQQKWSPSLQKALIGEKWGGSRLEGGELVGSRCLPQIGITRVAKRDNFWEQKGELFQTEVEKKESRDDDLPSHFLDESRHIHTTFAPTYASAAFGSMAGESLLLTTAMRELFPYTSHRLCMGRRNLRSIGRGRLLLRFLLSFQSRTLA